MKVIKLYMGIFFLAVLLLFSGCGKELENMTIPETGSGVESPDGSDQAEGEILRFQVSDAGFSDANTGSRAIDEGLTTKFEDGDQIGLFVVDSQNKILYANVPYTKDGDAWTAKENIRTKGYPVRVFAYYPYVPDDEIIAKVDSTADNYSDFFKTYINKLDISNQSSLADYHKADVMACMVEVGGKEEAREALTLTLNHMMGLVVLNLPETVTLSVNYYLKGDESFIWQVDNVTLPANLSEEFLAITGEIRPLKENTGYRYLCKSGEDNISFRGGFKTYEKLKNYMVNNATVKVGSRKTYNLFVKSFTLDSPLEYTPQVGDYYMENGAVLSNISNENKEKCIGIVFWSGNPTATDPVLKAANSQCTHGLVVSLKEVANIQWQANYESTTIQSWAEKEPFYISGGYKPLNNNPREIQGYNNTKILEAYNKSDKGKKFPVTILECFDAITDGVILPDSKTSDWYLPSPKELYELYNVQKDVNTSLSVFDNRLNPWNFWSSEENNSSHACNIYLPNGNFYNNNKSTMRYYVRLVLAF